MSIDLNVTMNILMANSMLQGMAIGVIWVPLTIASFATLENRFWAEAMAVFHLLRNIGSSFFISLCVADIVSVTAQNYSRMTEMISPFNERLTLPWVMGGWSIDSLPGPGAAVEGDDRQAAMIGYLDAFAMYTAASGAAVLAHLLVRRPPSRRVRCHDRVRTSRPHHSRRPQHVLDVVGTGREHDQPVEAERDPGAIRQPVFERRRGNPRRSDRFPRRALLARLVRQKAAALLGGVGQLAERIGELETADIQLEPLREPRIIGFGARQRGHRDGIIVKDRRRADPEMGLDALQKNAEEQRLPIVAGMRCNADPGASAASSAASGRADRARSRADRCRHIAETPRRRVRR